MAQQGRHRVDCLRQSDNISERDSTEHAHDYYPGFLKGRPGASSAGASRLRGGSATGRGYAPGRYRRPPCGSRPPRGGVMNSTFCSKSYSFTSSYRTPSFWYIRPIFCGSHKWGHALPSGYAFRREGAGEARCPVLHYPFREDFHFKALHTDQGSSDGFPVSGSMPGANIFIRLPSSSFITSMLSWTESTPWEFTPPPKSLPVTFAL